MDERILGKLSSAQCSLAARLAAVFQAANQELYLVGGIVRDALIPAPLPKDLDFATSAPTSVSRELLEQAGATSVYLIGERFGTVGAVFSDGEGRENVEITTYRRESYPDETRFPAVEFDVPLADDLSRRDFTMNAIAVDPGTGELVDPWGGEADIAMATIRAVGDPDERFQEDPLRLLRAARFVSQLGFSLAWDTEQAMAHHAGSLARISQERILAELTRLLVGKYVDHGLEVLLRTGLLTEAMPELAPLADEAESDLTTRFGREKDLWDHTLRVVKQAPARPAVRWASLLHDAGKPRTRSVDLNGEVHFFGHEAAGAALANRLLTRLGADKALRQSVVSLVELHGRPAAYDPAWTDSAVRRLALEASDVWDDLLDLAAADVTSGRERKRQEAAHRVTSLRAHAQRLDAESSLARLDSPLDGNDLMALFNMPPGPWIKRVKEYLREAVIDGDLRQEDQEQAITMARAFVSGEFSRSGQINEASPLSGSAG